MPALCCQATNMRAQGRQGADIPENRYRLFGSLPNMENLRNILSQLGVKLFVRCQDKSRTQSPFPQWKLFCFSLYLFPGYSAKT